MKTSTTSKTLNAKKTSDTTKSVAAKKEDVILKKTPSQKADSSAAKSSNGHGTNGNGKTNATTSASKTVNRDEIAAMAYKIWQEQGCPEGREEQHWRQAEQAVVRTDSHAATP